MRVALLALGLLIVARPIVHNGIYNHDDGKNTRKMFMFGIAKDSCLSLHVRLYTTVAALASPKSMATIEGGAVASGRWADASSDLSAGYRDMTQVHFCLCEYMR